MGKNDTRRFDGFLLFMKYKVAKYKVANCLAITVQIRYNFNDTQCIIHMQ